MPVIRFFGPFSVPIRKGAAALGLWLALSTGLWGTGGAAAAEAVIAVVGPATGRHAALLQGIVAGAGRAVEGLKSTAAAEPIRIADHDDGCDPARAKGAAAAIVALGPDLVIGHPCPAAAIAAAPVYGAAGIPFIALGVRHPALTSPRAGATIFRLAGRDDRQGEAAAEALLGAAPGRRIAIIQDRTAYARSILAETTGALLRFSVTPATVLPIVAGRRDYDSEIAKVVAAKAEAVLFAGYPSEATVLLRGLRKAGSSAVLIASDANATREFAEAAADAGLSGHGVKVLIQAELVAAPASGAPVAAGLDVLAAAAVEAWAEAARFAGTRQPEKVAAQLGGGVATTAAMGAISFDANGDARLPSYAAAGLVAGRWSGEIRVAR